MKRLDGRIDALNNKLEKEIKKLDDKITKEVAKLNERITAENNALKERVEALENANAGLQNALRKIIENLEGSGAWSGGMAGGFNQGRNLATGNINVFGGTPDGASFIRTNNGSTENDLAGGI